VSVVAVSLPNQERLAWWVNHLAELLPDRRVLAANDVTDADAVDYAVVWMPPTGMIAGWPNVKAVISIGAGIDHITCDKEFPSGVPIIKTIGPDMTQRMREYIALHVLRFHRELPDLERSQKNSTWEQVFTPTAPNRNIGILGMGHFGKACALTLRDLGFNVSGWSRSGTAVAGIETYNSDGLEAFLAQTEILVCLLPLTDETSGILNAKLFEKLPAGAKVINVGRGQHLVEQDLLAALESGQISSAVLDVFTTEPLPKDHVFWTHEKITVTPHVASLIDPISGGKIIADNIGEFDRASIS
jgi:glyoxylate/hydroxypyruvate reductase